MPKWNHAIHVLWLAYFTQYNVPKVHPCFRILQNSLLFKDDFPGGSDGKVSAYNAGDPGSIPGLGRSPGEGNDNPLQYSGLENSMDCIVHGVAKSWTGLSDFHFRFPERIDADCLRKETNGSTGKTESKETVFLPFPCTLGARVELLFWLDSLPLRSWLKGSLSKHLFDVLITIGASRVAQEVKNPPAMQEMGVWSLTWEDPLEKEVATHSSILAWKTPMDRGAWWATARGDTEGRMRLSAHVCRHTQSDRKMERKDQSHRRILFSSKCTYMAGCPLTHWGSSRSVCQNLQHSPWLTHQYLYMIMITFLMMLFQEKVPHLIWSIEGMFSCSEKQRACSCLCFLADHTQASIPCLGDKLLCFCKQSTVIVPSSD